MHFWHKQVEKALKKKLYRMQRELSVNHYDTKLQYPQECKDQESNKPLLPRMVTKVTEKHEAQIRQTAVPTSKTEKRFNRF